MNSNHVSKLNGNSFLCRCWNAFLISFSFHALNHILLYINWYTYILLPSYALYLSEMSSDSNFKSLDSSLDIKTQLSKVSIPVSISRLNSWISNLCSNLETVSAKQKLLENVTSPMCKMLLFGKMIVTFELMLQFDAQ